MQIEAGMPVISAKDQHLVPYPQEELDEEVKLGTIAYIYADTDKHKRFASWNKEQDQKNGAVKHQDSPHDETPRVATGKKPASAKLPGAPDITVSASHAPVATADLAAEDARLRESSVQSDDIKPGESLDDWIIRQKGTGALTMDGGRFAVDGHKFVGKKALAKYLDSRLTAKH
jgi:hypothetical protein